MKNHTKLFVLLTFLAAIFAFSCQRNTETSRSLTPTKAAETQIYKAVGVIKSIDTDASKITVDHEEIPGYMRAMEATVGVSDAKMLETVKIGDKIEFELERTASNVVITKLTKIGEVAQINGSEIYKTNCAECHGGTGEGASKGISLLKGHALKHSEKEYIEQVTDGEGKKMPAFKDKLSAEQIAAVVKYVREELQKDIPKEESAEHQH
jgi:mono/diheme cytochrome c family protein